MGIEGLNQVSNQKGGSRSVNYILLMTSISGTCNIGTYSLLGGIKKFFNQVEFQYILEK